MERGRSIRRVAVAALLVLGVAGAIGAVRHATDASRGAAASAASIVRAAAGARGAKPSRGRPRLHVRDDAWSEADEPAPGELDGERPAGTAPGADGKPEQAGPAGAPPESEDARLRAAASARDAVVVAANPANYALPTAPDIDPVTSTAAAVAPGRPPELEFAAFVASGPASVNRAAEIVGVRKPQVEEGVPVSLTGRVTEHEGGSPIAGAQVVVTSTFYVRRYFYDHHLREVARVETDGDGAYRIERLNADPAHFGQGGRLYLTVTAPGHAPALAVALAEVSPGVANKVPVVALERAVQSLRGRVIDYWEGRPVVGARVLATGAINPIEYPKDERAALFVEAPSATTDAEGRFVLEGLGSGVETISAHGGDDCIGQAAVALPFKGEFTLRTRQIRGRIEGSTIDEHDEPVALVTIDGGDNSTHSFADGRFVLENFRGDAVTIRFVHPDYAPVVLTGVRDGTANLVVRMERPRPVIVLRVHDPDTSQPVKRVTLEWTFAEGVNPPPATSPVRLAADGRYEVRVPEGATSIAVTAQDRTPGQVALAGRADGDVVDVPLALVSGR